MRRSRVSESLSRSGRSRTRGLARGGVLAICAMAMVVAAVGCSGRVQVGFERDRITLDYIPHGPGQGPRLQYCGTTVYNGRQVELYCDGQGRLILVRDIASGRWYRVIGPQPMLPPDVPHFTFNGMAYTLPPEPAGIILSVPDRSNLEILEQWGGSVQQDGTVRAGGTWQYDRALDRLDLSLCLDGTTWLPEPDAFPLAYELIVLPDADLPLMLHRVVGTRAEVLAYVAVMRAGDFELDVDGYGPVPAAMIQFLQTLWHPPQPG